MTYSPKLVVNFFGCPGSGKTVAATSVFSKLKRQHLDTVLITEFAHDKVVEENTRALANQLFIFANQQYKIYCAYEHAHIVVTDCPILLASVYNRRDSTALNTVMLEEHRRYNNLNIFMEFDSSYPYSMVGRVHSANESIQINEKIRGMLDLYDIPYLDYNSVSEDDIVELICATTE